MEEADRKRKARIEKERFEAEKLAAAAEQASSVTELTDEEAAKLEKEMELKKARKEEKPESVVKESPAFKPEAGDGQIDPEADKSKSDEEDENGE